MTTPPDDDEMREFVRRLFGRDEPTKGVDHTEDVRNFTRQLFNRDDPDDKG